MNWYRRAEQPSVQQPKSLTDAPEFQSWFGNSKVVDANGEPLPVYHGSGKSISSFESGHDASGSPVRHLGFFFSPSGASASQYAMLLHNEGQNVMQVYLSLQNPQTIPYQTFLELQRADSTNPDKRRYQKSYEAEIAAKQLRKAAEASGHDGFVLVRDNGEPFEYVAFRSSQIKSAIGNRGSFDAQNPDITAFNLKSHLRQASHDIEDSPHIAYRHGDSCPFCKAASSKIGRAKSVLHYICQSCHGMWWAETPMTKLAQTQFWGTGGSGMLFVCLDDNTALLVLRSQDVEQPGTWGIPGGAISGTEGFYSADELRHQTHTPEDASRASAEKETREELGTFPQIRQELGTTVYRKGGFAYTTYVADISAEEKEHLSNSINLNWENDSFEWFPLDRLPIDLHFGMKFVQQQHPIFQPKQSTPDNNQPAPNFKATHRLGYDHGVWLPVMRVGNDWVTKDGKKFPCSPDDLTRPIKPRT